LINLRIDDTPVQAEPGQTILVAARGVGIRIPTLCQVDALSPVGACRLCLVEIRNWNGRLVPACALLFVSLWLGLHVPAGLYKALEALSSMVSFS